MGVCVGVDGKSAPPHTQPIITQKQKTILLANSREIVCLLFFFNCDYLIHLVVLMLSIGLIVLAIACILLNKEILSLSSTIIIDIEAHLEYSQTL
jgi:hypothetical protein